MGHLAYLFASLGQWTFDFVRGRKRAYEKRSGWSTEHPHLPKKVTSGFRPFACPSGRAIGLSLAGQGLRPRDP
jgi:hypothetical protein